MAKLMQPWKWLAVAAVVGWAAVPRLSIADSIVTGSSSGTYYRFGNDMREIVAPDLQVKDSKGSINNVERLSAEPGVSLAIVQSDVYNAFVRRRDDPAGERSKRQEYGALLRNLRVFMPLYKEEVHFLVRKDDPMEYVHDIKGKHIWMDAEESGTYLTTLTIYRALFDSLPTAVKPTISPRATGDSDSTKTRRTALMRLSLPSAFEKEADYEAIDVMVLVGGQPLSLLKDTIPDNLKLLKFDPNQGGAAKVKATYREAAIGRDTYPKLNLPEGGVTTLAVEAYLITAAFQDPKRNLLVSQLASRMCSGYSTLRDKGHPKWKEVAWQPGAPLPPLAAGWRYADDVKANLDACRSAGRPEPVAGTPSPPPPPSCPRAMELQGLCAR